MVAAGTAAPSSRSLAMRGRDSSEAPAVLLNSSPFDIALAVPVDVERGHMIFAIDVGQGFDGRPEASDPGAGQGPDRESLLDQRLAALEVNAIMDRYLQVARGDLRQLEEARIAEQAAGDADLDVVLDGGPDVVGLLDLNPGTIPQEMV